MPECMEKEISNCLTSIMTSKLRAPKLSLLLGAENQCSDIDSKSNPCQHGKMDVKQMKIFDLFWLNFHFIKLLFKICENLRFWKVVLLNVLRTSP